MGCYFHHLQNCFIDYFDDLVPDEAVIYASDVPFKYNEQESTYTEYVFLATSRDHKFMLSHEGKASNV